MFAARVARIRSRWTALAAAAALLPCLACGTVELPQTLVLEDPSTITIGIPIFNPPYDMETTTLAGGIESMITADLGLLELLGVFIGKALVADVSVDNILIGGTELVIGGLLPTGTLCVGLDELMPGGGEAHINPLLGVAQFLIDLNTTVYLTDPVVGPALGGEFPFGASIDSMVPLTIGDLLGLLGGGSGNLTLTQEIDTTLPPDTPVIGPAAVTATLTLSSADALPLGDPLVQECAAFLAGL